MSIFKAFTDGSCYDGVGGYAAVYVEGPLSGYVDAEKIESGCTNIRAEGQAIIAVLEAAREEQDWRELEIYTDSEFWKNMIELYMPSWSPSKFKKMKNYDLTTKIWSLWKEIDKPARIIFVPSHKSNWKTSVDPYKRWCFSNNDKADKIANEVRKSN